MYQWYTIGSVNKLQSPVNAKTIQILLKLVVKLYGENMGGQMGNERTKASFLSKRKFYKYRSCLKLLDQDNSRNTLIRGLKVVTKGNT